MKLYIKESSKVTFEVIDNNKVIEKVSCGKKAKQETLEMILNKYFNIESINHEWKVAGIGGAGLWNSEYNVKVDKFSF